jgi:hypothetical protein
MEDRVIWFTENSTVPMVTGTLLVIIFLAMAFTSREKLMLQLAIVIGLLTAATVICERLIVTDKEQVTESVYELADLVQANNMQGVLGFVSLQYPETRDEVSAEMPRYDFDNCRIIGINYFKNETEGSKDTAEICFVVSVRVRLDNSPELLFGQRRVTLHFEKEADGKWRVFDYSHEDPRAGIGL